MWCSQLGKEQALGAQFLRHGPNMMTVRALKGKPQTRLRDTDLVAARRHPWIRRIFGLTVLAGVAYAVWRVIEENGESKGAAWESQPFPFPPQPRVEASAAEVQEVAPAAVTAEAWVEVDGDTCPASHPVKGKLSSGIYHVPGGANYERTHADRCYADEDAAQADGLRRSKV